VNTEYLKQNVGQQVWLRPLVLLVTRKLPDIAVLSTGEPIYKTETEDTNFRWTIESVSKEGVTLRCSFTDHRITLSADNVREYRKPDFLLLKCQLTLDGDKVLMEPRG